MAVKRKAEVTRYASDVGSDREAGVGPKESERRPVALTPRDRELFVHLAIARYLSLEQISRLVFPGKNDSIARRRLSRLVSGKHRRLPFRTKAGGSAVAWSLKPLGYLAAHNLFEASPEQPTHDPPVPSSSSTTCGSTSCTSRWQLPRSARSSPSIAGRSVGFPATRRDCPGPNSTATPARWLICPDATLELPHAKRRVFIELETGAHTLGFNREGAPGRNATKTKIERYTRFVVTPTTAIANGTFYAQAFPDAWPAELLFVVPSVARRDAITDFVAGSWRPANDSVQFAIRALTFDEAPLDLCRAQLSSEVALPRIETAGGALTPAEIAPSTISTTPRSPRLRLCDSSRRAIRNWPRSSRSPSTHRTFKP